MKVNFTLWSAGVSGGNRTIYQLANKLTEHGHDVSITSLAIGGTHEWFGEVNADFNYVGLNFFQKAARKFLLVPRWDVDWTKRLVEAIPECDINVATYCLTAYPTVWSNKGKLFYFIQHFEPWFFSDQVAKRMAELTYDLPLRKLVVSNWLKDKVGGTLVGNGIDLKKFCPAAAEKSEVPKVLFFARGIDWKERWRESLLSTGSFNAEVVDGSYSEEQLIKAYQSAWVTVFYSDNEGFGLIPLESMACGTPVLTVDCLGINEYMKHGENGMVISKNVKVETVIQAISSLLNDEKLRKKLIDGGFKTVSQYSFEKVVDNFEEAAKR